MKKTNFTLIELLVVTAIIAILISIFIGAITEIQAVSYRATCVSNMKQNYIYMGTYAAEYNMWCPANYNLNVSNPDAPKNDLQSANGTQRLFYNLYVKPGEELHPTRQRDWSPIFRCPAYAFNGSSHGNISDAGIGFHQTSSGWSDLKFNNIPNPTRKMVMMDWPASYVSGGNNVFSVTTIAGNSNTAHVPGAGVVGFLDSTAFVERGELNYSWPGPYKDFLKGRHGPGSVNIAYFDGAVVPTRSEEPARDFYMPETASGYRKLYWDRAGYGSNSVSVTVNNIFNPRLE